MTQFFAIVQSTGHGFVTRHTTRHVAFVARDIDHNRVTTGTRHLHRDQTRRTFAFVTRVGRRRMATGSLFRTRMRAYKWRRSTRDGRFLDRFTASTDDIVEICFQTPSTASLVTGLLTKMFTTCQTLITSYSTHMEAFRVRSIVEGGATTRRTRMFAACLLTTTSSLTNEFTRELLLVWIHFETFHRLRSCVAATRQLNFRLTWRARPWVTHGGASMSAFAHLVANTLAGGNFIETRLSRFTIRKEKQIFRTATASLNELRLQLTGLTRAGMTDALTTMISTVQRPIAHIATREVGRFSSRNVFQLIWCTTGAHGRRLTTITHLLDLLATWGTSAFVTGVGTRVAFAI